MSISEGKNHFGRWTSLGTVSTTPKDVARGIILANCIALFLAGIVAALGFDDLIHTRWRIACFDLLEGCVFLSVLPLNRAGFTGLTRIALIVFIHALVFGMSWVFGPSLRLDTGFFLLVCLPLVLFGLEERWKIFLSILTAMISQQILLRYSYQSSPQLIPATLQGRAPVQELLVMSVLTAIVYYWKLANSRSERSLAATLHSLQLSETRNNALLSALPDWVFTLDRSDTVIYHLPLPINDGYAPWGVTPSVPMSDGLPETFSDRLKELASRAREQRSVQRGEMEIETHRGLKPVEVRVVASADHEVIVIVQDVSERKRTEARLAEQHQQLIFSSRMSALGEMAGGVAHEINNPLMIIQFQSSLIKSVLCGESVEIERAVGLAEGIKTTSKRIADIIRGMLFVARDADQDPFVPTPLSQIIQSTLGLCSERFQKQGIEIRADEIPHDLIVDCKATQIAQVMLNLLNNAFDAALPNESVGENQERWIRVSVATDQEHVRILVENSGKEIPSQLSQKIFQPFFTTKEVGKGTGLGLSISKGIIENHQGVLYLDRGAGLTRFVVQLPKKQTDKRID